MITARRVILWEAKVRWPKEWVVQEYFANFADITNCVTSFGKKSIIHTNNYR